MTDRHLSVAGFAAGLIVVTLAILARTAWGSTAPPVDDPGWLATYLSPGGRVILGGIACLGVAYGLGKLRERKGWLRRGAVGNLAAAVYGSLLAFGAVVALGGGVDAGLASVGGSFVAALGLNADPERVVRAKATAAGTIEAGEDPAA